LNRALRIGWTGAAAAGLLAGGIGLVVAVRPEWWVGLYTEDPAVLASGSLYLRIVGGMYVFQGVGLSLYFASQGAGTVFWPVAAGVLRVIVAVGGAMVAVLLLDMGLKTLFVPDGRRNGHFRLRYRAVDPLRRVGQDSVHRWQAKKPLHRRKIRMNHNIISSNEVKNICLEAGADAVGLVEIERKAIDTERAGIQRVYPKTRSIIAFMRAANRENVRSEARYVANDELHRTGDEVTEISRRVIRQLNRLGVRGAYVNESWPMDMNRWPGKLWDVGHKTMAVEAGLGHMGLEPSWFFILEYGACVSLNTLLIDTEADEYDNRLKRALASAANSALPFARPEL
jgi:hypothetical protein